MELHNHTNAVISQLNVPILLARLEHRHKTDTIVFHVTGDLPRHFVRNAKAAFAERGQQVICRVQTHSMRRLSKQKSLEAITKSLGSGEILYDPTHIATRATALVTLAKWLRAEISENLGTIGFESRRRTLYVILNERKHESSFEALQATMQKVTAVVIRWQKTTNPDYELAVRVGFDAPPASQLVAIDSASTLFNVKDALYRQYSRLFRNLGLATLFSLGSTTIAAAESSDPAVSEPNFTIAVQGSNSDGQSLVHAKGTIPLGHSFGAHLEAATGDGDFDAISAELFWRDPEIGMFGIWAAKGSLDDFDLSRTAIEGDLYLDSVTLGVTAGHQNSDLDADDGSFAAVDIKYYVTPDFMVSAGRQVTPHFDFNNIGAEWRPAFQSFPGLSFYADAEFGNNGYDAVVVGLKYHFGKKGGSTLLHRDRREDPWTNLGLGGGGLLGVLHATKEECERISKGYGGTCTFVPRP